MNIGEANDLNIFLRWFLREPSAFGGEVTEEGARMALARLANKSVKALMAGLDAGDVERLWDAARRPPAT